MSRSRTRPDARPAVPPAPLLLVTRDLGLVDELHRLAAAAGALLEVAAGADAARPLWASAPTVLVGTDLLAELADRLPARRGGVHVASLAAVADRCYPAALAVGAESVVELPAAETWLVETLTDTTDGARGPAPVVGVVGGSGGAGATTFAAALAALAAAQTRPVTLLDADPLGSGIERIAGLDELDGTRWATLMQSAGRLGSRSLRASLPQRSGVAVLGWGGAARDDLHPAVVREVVSAARRGSGLVVADLPRYRSPGTLELLHRCDVLVVVVQLTVAAVAAAAQVVGAYSTGVPRSLLVARGPVAGLDAEQVAEILGLQLAAAMTDQRGLAEDVDLGMGPVSRRRGPLARAVRATLAQLPEQAHTPAAVPA